MDGVQSCTLRGWPMVLLGDSFCLLFAAMMLIFLYYRKILSIKWIWSRGHLPHKPSSDKI